jgi:hypothetical protein
MAGQCPRGRLDATQGGLHRGTAGSTTAALPPARTPTLDHLVGAQQVPGEEPARCRDRRRNRCEIPSGIRPWISSERKRPSKKLGGGGRGHWGEYFAQDGDGDAHRRQPESASNGGGDPVARGATGVRERRQPGLGWVGLTDPDPSQWV